MLSTLQFNAYRKAASALAKKRPGHVSSASACHEAVNGSGSVGLLFDSSCLPEVGEASGMVTENELTDVPPVAWLHPLRG